MGAVGSFIKDVAKTAAKGATSALGAAIPYVGPALAEKVNSLYKKGGKVLKFAEGGVVVPPGFKARPINTEAQLVDLIKKFPEQADKAGLSVDLIKEKSAELQEMAPKKRGGRRKKVEVDTVMVMPDKYANGGAFMKSARPASVF
jgi:hypothetical protein